MGIIKSYKSASKQKINGRETFEVTLGLEAEPNIRTNPKDIGLVLDKSTSMSGQTLISMKEGANHFIDVLNISTQGSLGVNIGNNSKIGVVTFSDTADIVQVLTNSVVGLKKAVNDIQVRGTTNHAAAFEKGIELLKTSTKDKVLVLFTDGNSNAGSEGFDVAARAKAMGIEVYCIGFGSQNQIDMASLEKWASAPTSEHILITPNYQEIEKMFDILAEKISEPETTGIELTDHVNKCFDVVSIGTVSKGTANIIDKHSVKWNIPSIGAKTKERVNLTFTVRDNGTCTGNVLVNESADYRDNELNTIDLPAPTITIENTAVEYYEDEPIAVDFDANGCEDYVTVDAGDVTLSGLGRIISVNATIKNVCPGKRLGVAAILSEVDGNGLEHNRGMKTLLIPAHNDSACRDVLVKCIKFVVPEELALDGDTTSMCNVRSFRVKFMANYLDTDYTICR